LLAYFFDTGTVIPDAAEKILSRTDYYFSRGLGRRTWLVEKDARIWESRQIRSKLVAAQFIETRLIEIVFTPELGM